MARCDYANARLGAMRTRLQTTRALAELAALPSLAARLERLDLTLYAAPAGTDLDGACAIAEHAPVEDCARVLSYIEGERQRGLVLAGLAWLDAAPLTSLARGIAAGIEPIALRPLLAPTPRLDGAVLDRLATAPDLPALAHAIGELRPSLRLQLEAPPTPQALPALERAIHRAILDGARREAAGLDEDARVVRGLLALAIDLRNQETLLALDGTSAARELFLDGGERLTVAEWEHEGRLAPERRRAPAERRWRRALPRDLDATALARALETPWGTDRLLERLLHARARHEALTRPSSVAVPLAYLYARRAESRGVRLALRGADFAIAPGALVPLLEV